MVIILREGWLNSLGLETSCFARRTEKKNKFMHLVSQSREKVEMKKIWLILVCGTMGQHYCCFTNLMNLRPLDSHRKRLEAVVSDLQEPAVTFSELLRGCQEGSAFTWPQNPLS